MLILAKFPMRIYIRVRTRSKEAKIEKIDDHFIARLNSPPEKGKANRELIKRLAKYFNVSKSQITIVQGFKFPEKVVEIRYKK